MTFKVVFCIPTRKKPHPAFLKALEDSLPLIEAAGYEHAMCAETGNPYISAARATCLKAALKANADIIVFLDDDVSWEPSALVKLIQTPGDVVAGTYRCKQPETEINYMGKVLQDEQGRPTVMREDGCLEASQVPAGFLKVTRNCIDVFMRGRPDLCYGPIWDLSVDLFNHGAYKGLWWGEDYAFCRNWRDLGGKIWLIPNINVDHNEWDPDKQPQVYKGNFHEYLLKQPGGVNGPPMEDESKDILPKADNLAVFSRSAA